MKKNIFEIEYTPILDIMESQIAIKFVKDTFQKLLAKKLKLTRVSAPLFVLANSGINDHLSGKEEPINFHVDNISSNVEIVQSLAKWKRIALAKYNFKPGTGLYTDMNAIRKDEQLDFIHSLYVDQWDWEKVILEEDRNISYLKKTVRKIYAALYELSLEINKKYPILKHDLPKKVFFISSSKLKKMYPLLTNKEREDEITRKYKAVFIYQIGWPIYNHPPHDDRASDYDDWLLNGDLLLYYPLYDMALEISSMGIRVNNITLIEQIKFKHEEYKFNNYYCQRILNNDLPLTIGGGIGQSRLCMYMLKKAHIGEVQVSLWDENEIIELKKKNINLL